MTVTESAQRFREFKMPDVGEGLTEAEILKWHVKPGDAVTDGQLVCEVETAKAAVELPIPYDGIVHEIRFPEGDTVDVGTVIISVDTGAAAGQASGDDTGAAAAPAAPAGPEAAEKREPVLVGYGVTAASTKRRPRKASAPGGTLPTGSPVSPGAAAVPANPVAVALQDEVGGRGTVAPALGRARTGIPTPPLAKPPVRKLAKELGVDLAAVVPSGAGDIVTRDDVLAAATAPPLPATEQAPSAPGASGTGRETRVPVKGVRKATAAAMVASAFTAPHVTEFVTFDITRTMRLVAELKQDKAFEGRRVSPLLVVAKALLIAIRRNPEVNAAWDEANQEIVHKGYVNLGIAAATPRGLIVPNIKDAQALTLPELAAALTGLISTAREGRTAPADMQGGTVTITNVGVFGIDTGTPILNPGESAILALGAIKELPWVHKGKVKPRQVTTLALSFDHRMVDGELGSRVLGDIAAVLEYPKRMMTWA